MPPNSHILLDAVFNCTYNHFLIKNDNHFQIERDMYKYKEKRRGRRGIAALLMIILLALPPAAAGCSAGGASGPDAEDGMLQIVATIFPAFDLAREASGGQAHVSMLLRPGEEIHSYEPTPMDIRMIRDCDLFIYTGGENDVWVDQILDNMGDQAPQTLRMVELVETVEEEHVEGMQDLHHEHSHEEGEEDHAHEEEAHEDEDHAHEHSGDSSEHDHEEIDEHVWTSPVNAAIITEAIAETLCTLDPSRAEHFRSCAAAFREQAMELDTAFRKIVEEGNRTTIVFGDRFPVRYFAEEYGLDYYAAFPGCASESEPSAATMAFLIDKVREEKIPVVFSIELSSGTIARAIAESSGAVQRTFHTCHNVTRDEFESGASYLSLMRGNLEVLREALQ